jgi:hypothetical protein
MTEFENTGIASLKQRKHKAKNFPNNQHAMNTN